DHELARTLLEESLPPLRETDTKAGIGAALLILGCIERDAGDPSSASTSFLDALAAFQTVGRTRDQALCLVASARLLAATRPSGVIAPIAERWSRVAAHAEDPLDHVRHAAVAPTRPWGRLARRRRRRPGPGRRARSRAPRPPRPRSVRARPSCCRAARGGCA